MKINDGNECKCYYKDNPEVSVEKDAFFISEKGSYFSKEKRYKRKCTFCAQIDHRMKLLQLVHG